MAATNYKVTKVYKLAFDQAMDIFEITKKFPREEIYSLTDQIRRSSRSVCANIAEAYRKKRYPSHFISKVSDSDTENSETDVWLQFSLACQYIPKEKFDAMRIRNEEVGRLLNHMLMYPERY
jgi:four helix bundle protein